MTKLEKTKVESENEHCQVSQFCVIGKMGLRDTCGGVFYVCLFLLTFRKSIESNERVIKLNKAFSIMSISCRVEQSVRLGSRDMMNK